jgi:hypothetical protein
MAHLAAPPTLSFAYYFLKDLSNVMISVMINVKLPVVCGLATTKVVLCNNWNLLIPRQDKRRPGLYSKS